MLTVKCAPTYKSERQYICRVLLREFLGLEYILQYEERKDWQISTDDDKELLLPDILFQTPDNQWLSHESLPVQPLTCWDTRELELEGLSSIDRKLPVIYGDLDFHKKVSHVSDNTQTTLLLPIDIFGSSFFMLARYEEVIKKDRDKHNRFPAWASLAYQEGFLDRPIVNEYLEILWTYMKKPWPGLKRKKRAFQMRVSCDVDHVYQEGIKNPLRQLRHVGGDLIYRNSPTLALKTMANYFATKMGNFSFDPYFSAIDRIMDINKKAGNQVVFNFKAGRTNSKYDAAYSLDEPIVRKLLRCIHERGHEIGFHPSYNTYQDIEQFCRESDNLRRVLDEEGIQQDRLGGRQHYLRWETPTTARCWEAAGLDYDSTLSFADHAGFRCGVCYEYPLYNLCERKALYVRERPLVLMEATLGDKKYMGKGYGEAFIRTADRLKKVVRQYRGDFTLLWHNTHLIAKEHKITYQHIVL